MRVLYYLCCLLCCFLYTETAYSSYLSSSTSSLTEHSKNKLIGVRPESQDSSQFSLLKIKNSFGQPIKVASVSFITETDETSIINNVKDLNTGTSCEGYPYTTEMSISNCAKISICRDGKTQKIKCTSCKGNMTLGSDGRCTCDQSAYPYNLRTNTCTYAYDVTHKCQETKANGGIESYYAGCKCPENWTDCSGQGEVGGGRTCTLGGKTYYEGCTCQTPYLYLCQGSGDHYDLAPSGDYCTNTFTNIRYYRACTEVCWKGYYHNMEEWWNCGEPQNQCEEEEGDVASCINAVGGDIYYSDGTCGSSCDVNKQPIGIIAKKSCNGNSCTLGIFYSGGGLNKNGQPYWSSNAEAPTYAEAQALVSNFAPAACAGSGSSLCPGVGQWRLPTSNELRSMDMQNIVNHMIESIDDGVDDGFDGAWNCGAASTNSPSLGMSSSAFYISEYFYHYLGSYIYIFGDIIDDYTNELFEDNDLIWFFEDFAYWTTDTSNVCSGIPHYSDIYGGTGQVIFIFEDGFISSGPDSGYHPDDYGYSASCFPTVYRTQLLPYAEVVVSAQ